MHYRDKILRNWAWGKLIWGTIMVILVLASYPDIRGVAADALKNFCKPWQDEYSSGMRVLLLHGPVAASELEPRQWHKAVLFVTDSIEGRDLCLRGNKNDCATWQSNRAILIGAVQEGFLGKLTTGAADLCVVVASADTKITPELPGLIVKTPSTYYSTIYAGVFGLSFPILLVSVIFFTALRPRVEEETKP